MYYPLFSIYVLLTIPLQAKNNNIKNLVYITSDKCYQNMKKNSGYSENDYLGGHDNYSASKACAEIIFHAYKSMIF